MQFLSHYSAWLPLVLALTSLSAALVASTHVILKKSDNRAAVAWVGVIWLAPLLGSLLYLLLGINRIKRRARVLREPLARIQGQENLQAFLPDVLEQFVPAELRPLSRLSNTVAHQPILGGNRIRPLYNGNQAYPRMLDAITSARHSISLSSYIFGNDNTGREFVDALSAAVRRGVEVRVLIDAVGLRYSVPSIVGRLNQAKVPMARFMPSRLPWALPFMNLRNHRKILVVDGRKGFVGGMNIAEGNRLDRKPSHPIRDLHFDIEGPVVSELQAVFCEDWQFAANEMLSGERWFPKPQTPGASLSRVLADGPDERFDTIRQVISGALSVARSRIRIMTPYFLPDATLQDALTTAALRGVKVDIILPAKNNLAPVAWASEAQLPKLLRWGVRVWFSDGYFDHSKLFTMDGQWAMIGSANWDPRSLSLNFECNVECYDELLVQELDRHFEQCLATAHERTFADLMRLSIARKFRNGLARLFTPYL